MERYYSYSRFIKEYFGEKLYKICIDGGFTCPNRDGTLATGGCIFCSEGGSGEFTENASLSVSEQIHLGKSQTSRKYQGEHYIAYFQAFTNTYAPVDRLRALYEEAITAPETNKAAKAIDKIFFILNFNYMVYSNMQRYIFSLKFIIVLITP